MLQISFLCGMLRIIKANPYFFIPFLLFLLTGGFALTYFGSAALFLQVNARHTPAADIFFTYFSWLGEGLTAAAISITLLFLNRKAGYASIAAFLLSSGTAQALKHFVFDDVYRPREYFSKLKQPIRLIEGLEVHSANSFPSGHSTTAFAIFCIFAIMSRRRQQGLLFFVLAMGAAFSRVYLSQHFPADVYAGACIGTFWAVICWWWFHERKPVAAEPVAMAD
ncbi:MAG: phosphatase PAP2 family protein [Bacteroidota bacterium]